ncbi:tubulointerstitial nephritis antigen-like isoform X2 [Cimex lectularius]|uniref:SMB domain-containing protein n=1 Tax=Cimex lectularius TaxID=79782 RepID=A0A8I6SCN7_CIMLE|nr:tubulointerstitial nephritis antigen-like isoform X2 [Cimex lectularius]
MLLALQVVFGRYEYAHYCKLRGCCPGRQDDCLYQIDRHTVCYCDEFCVKTKTYVNSIDCCSDYWSSCRRSEPWVYGNNTCYVKDLNREYKVNGEFKINCNKCKCHVGNRNMNISCDEEVCVVDDKLISLVNSRNLGWTASKQNEFWGLTIREGFAKLLGTFYFSQKVLRMSSIHVRVRSLPHSFDAREEWPGYIQGPKNQGHCGASWAFSTISVASDRWAIESKGNFTNGLSYRQLFLCSKSQRQCNGGHITKAWRFLKKYGLLPEMCLPWDWNEVHNEKVCHKKTAKAAHCPAIGSFEPIRRMGPAYRIEGEKQIMQEIMTNGPVQATMTVYREFFLYKEGVYNCANIDSTNLEGFHSVKLIGWGESIYEEKYWLAVNSWGTSWGEGGYFRITRGQQACRIETFVIGAHTIQSTSKKLPFDVTRRR